MTRFFKRAIEKVSRLDSEQSRILLNSVFQENERLDAVLDSMTDGIMVCDTSHNLVLFNKAAERLFAFPINESLEKPLWSTIHDEEISDFLKQVLLGDDRIYDREFTIDSKGSIKILSISVMPLVVERSIKGNLVHFEDITEKRAKEARLRRAENLASLTTLAAGVAHEIKNPLGSISIRMQLLQKSLSNFSHTNTMEQKDHEMIKKHIDVVNEEIERLNRIVVDFLFAVRPMNIELELTNLNMLLVEVIDFMKYELESLSVITEFELEENLPLIPLDKRFIKQAILNLVKNSLAAMKNGGALCFTTKSENDDIKLVIEDTGEGISEENLAKIFEPYFTTRDSGSGLGLTLVFKIIREHSGEISVRSKLNEGTAFTLSFKKPSSEHKLLSYDSNDEPHCIECEEQS